MTLTARFPIKFDAAYARLSSALFISPSDSYVDIVGNVISVRMSWAFRAKFERSVVSGVSLCSPVPLTRGVHGWRGRWLVNGAGDGIVAVDLEPSQRAYVMGFPVRLRQLRVSVGDPAAVAAAVVLPRAGVRPPA